MKKATCIISLLVIATSCVPQSKYDELEKKYYASLQGERKSQKAIQEKEDALKSLSDQYSSLQQQQEALAKKKAQLDAEYSDLQIEYATKLKDMEDLKTKNAQISNEVQTTEQSRKKILNELEQTQGQLQEKIKRINELEGLISQQKESVSKLKNKLQIALKNYEGKGITVEEKEGNIYVSMENKLLFPSASWTVEAEGIKALQDLSEVLSKDNNLNIIIQGHTDSDKYAGNGNIKDNWDLSVMRATAITKILQSEGVSPKQMTASGKSEYAPLANNSTATGKAINRRVDIIIAPNLSEITKILNDL
ncbi:OmpA family protein [Apibacter sp.]|uniref:OmpA/MotB family protein n=1 Tax=Apibacter sp. TaxID=2023709 RepID=UPI0025F89833|nr:OmpA family protein [Apibacter sp.]MCT6868738.1 OmpA family protein [Apibacter sp.]